MMNTQTVENKKTPKVVNIATKEEQPRTRLDDEWMVAQEKLNALKQDLNGLLGESSRLSDELANPSTSWTSEEITAKSQRSAALVPLIKQRKLQVNEAAHFAEAERRKYLKILSGYTNERNYLRDSVGPLKWSIENNKTERGARIQRARVRVEEAKAELQIAEDELKEALAVEPRLLAQLSDKQKRLAELEELCKG